MADPALPLTLTILQPDDFHLHLRDGDVLFDTATAAARQFNYATIMPNLQPPVTTADMAVAYRQRILSAIPSSLSHSFHPLMTLYLQNSTSPQQILDAKAAGVVACKLYPAGATTHSSQGVSLHDTAALERLSPTFQAMADTGLLLLIHGEVTDPSVDIFDRESTFLSTFLPSILSSHPTLRIVLEHITTKDAVDFLLSIPSTNLAATITPHHLLVNRNAIFHGGLNPHYYCLPILKAEVHRQALLAAATSGDRRFFAGTDSAPHSKGRKMEEGCAGCYVAYGAMELYAQAFEEVGKLNELEGFISKRGREWYGVGEGEERRKITLKREEWTVPLSMPFGTEEVVPFLAGKKLKWKIVETQPSQ